MKGENVESNNLMLSRFLACSLSCRVSHIERITLCLQMGRKRPECKHQHYRIRVRKINMDQRQPLLTMPGSTICFWHCSSLPLPNLSLPLLTLSFSLCSSFSLSHSSSPTFPLFFSIPYSFPSPPPSSSCVCCPVAWHVISHDHTEGLVLNTEHAHFTLHTTSQHTLVSNASNACVETKDYLVLGIAVIFTMHTKFSVLKVMSWFNNGKCPWLILTCFHHFLCCCVKNTDQTNSRRKWFCSAFWLQSITLGSQDRNQEAGTEAKEECCCLAYSSWLAQLAL